MDKASPYSSGLKMKTGKKIYLEGSSTPGKRGRREAPAPRCQVEGCDLHLTDAKPYYSRHKVCALHSKSSKVLVAGIEQRFCQQCSRFHQLAEFDQGKRSCRRRLAGHNERRRKPPLFSSPFGTLYNDDDEHSRRGGRLTMGSSSSPVGGRLLPPPPPNPFLCISSSSSEECLSGALSLLSNHHHHHSSTSLFNNTFLGSAAAPPLLDNFSSPWTSHLHQPDLGLGQPPNDHSSLQHHWSP